MHWLQPKRSPESIFRLNNAVSAEDKKPSVYKEKAL